MKTKILSVFLALAFVLAMMPTALAATGSATFRLVSVGVEFTQNSSGVYECTVQPVAGGYPYVTVAFQITGVTGTLDSLSARISYDSTQFELDSTYESGVVKVEDDSGYTANYTGISQIKYITVTGTMPSKSYVSSEQYTIASFRMKVLGTGGTISFSNTNNTVGRDSVTTQNLHVSVGTSTPTTYTVTYDLAGGSMSDGTANSVTVNDGDIVTLPAAPTRQYYNFAGWKIGSSTEVQEAGSRYTPSGNIDITAQWTEVAKPTAPSVSAVDQTASSSGSISGTTAAMEYSTSTDFSSTMRCDADSTSVAPGTYYVRVAASGNTPAGEYTIVTVNAYQAPAAPDPEPSESANPGGGDTTPTTPTTPADTTTTTPTTPTTPVDTTTTTPTTPVDTTPTTTPTDTAGGNAGDDTTATPPADVVNTPSDDGDTVDAGDTVNDAANPFEDVDEGKYYYEAVLWAVENGITDGTSETTFSPDASCTRAQAVTFLWRAAESPEPTSTEMPYADVSPDAYYYKAVLWAMENGITKGTSATSFSPDDTCTRAHIATFLWRAQNQPESEEENPFLDVSADAYYAAAVQWAAENDITNGTSETTFGPNKTCTRGQIVTFLYRNDQASSEEDDAG
jgi:hypothetical protein